MEGEEVTVSAGKLATLKKVKEKVKENKQLSVIGGMNETGSPYLRVWGGRALAAAALNHTPLVEMVVVPEEDVGVISCTLVSYRREPLHSATFVITDLDTSTGLPCFLDYLQTRLGQNYSLCSGFPEATLLTSLPGHQITAATFNKCLVERQPNGGGGLLLRSRLCQPVRPNEDGEEERCPACVQLFHSVLPPAPQSSRLMELPEPEQSKNCPFEACSRTFRREKPYQRHLKSHTQVKCDNCHVVFASMSQLDTHMRKAHKQKNFEKRRDIDNPVGTLDLLPDEDENTESRRAATESESKQFSCGQCGAVYQYEKAFQKHFQTHRDDGGKDIFNCDQCSHICQTEEQLKEHKEKKHTTFNCDQCDSVSSSSKALEKHKRKVHSKAEDQCHLCGKNVKRTSMTNHVKMVHQADEMRRHICNVCGNKYKTKTDLDRHYTKHTGQRQYTCPTCGKGFRFWGGLDDCLRRHQGSLRHSCPTCGKGFNSKFRLGVHQRTHSGARPFQCPCCSYDCARKDNLLTHIRRTHRLTPAEAEILGNQKFLKERPPDDEDDPGTFREGEEIDDEINLSGNEADEPLDMSAKDKNGLKNNTVIN